MKHGQDSILLLLALTAAYVRMAKGRDFPAGFLLSFGLMKFHLTLPIATGMTILRRSRFAAGFLLGLLLLIGVSVLGVGETATVGYPKFIASFATSAGGTPGLTPEHMVNMWAVLAFVLPHSLPANSRLWITIGSSVLVTLAGLWICWRFRTDQSRLPLVLSALVVITLIGALHTYPYDLTILLLPVCLIATSLHADTRQWSRWVAFLGIACLFVAPYLRPMPTTFLGMAFLFATAISARLMFGPASCTDVGGSVSSGGLGEDELSKGTAASP